MRLIIYTSVISLLTSIFSIAQNDEPLNLENALVVAMQDKTEDRYTLELGIIELLRKHNILAKSSLNILKNGQDPTILASDSIKGKLSNEGVNTYMLISVRGFNKRFNPSKNIPSLKDELRSGHLFPIWRETASTVTFTIIFYRNAVPVHYELIRVRAGNSRDKMMKRLIKKMERRITKEWKS